MDFEPNPVYFKIEEGKMKFIEPDVVNQPPHYTSNSIEAIDYIESILSKEEQIGWYRGTIAKYMHRFRYKNGLEDLKKAQWYLDRLIKLMEKE